MNKLIQSNLLIYLLFAIVGLSFSSCITTKQTKYFQNIPDSTRFNNIKLPPYNAPVIHSDDVLGISIATLDDKASASINAINGGGAAVPGAADLNGFLVDSLGNIQVPILGTIKVSGYTAIQVSGMVKDMTKKYYLEPIVTVKIKSFRVSVMGEVAKPGIIYLTTPKASIVDVLNLAGDLSSYARRDNVLLMRHNQDNTLSTIRIDLTKSDVFSSPYYYMQSNDLIYVEPTANKAISSDATFNRNLTLGTLALSVFTTILYLFR